MSHYTKFGMVSGFEDGAVWQSRGFFVRKDWLVGKSVALKRAITTEDGQQDE